MAKLMVRGYECGGSADDAASIACLDKNGNASTVQAELDGMAGSCVDHLESNSAELPLSANQGRVLNEKIEEVFQLGTNIKAQIIGSLANTNLGLNEDSSWEDIFSGLDTLFPDQYNVLTKLTSADWTKSGSGSSSISSGKISLSCSGGSHTTLTSSDILASSFNKIVCSWSKNNSDYRNGLSFKMVHSGGTISFNEGTTTTDISNITGNIHFVATASSNYVGEEVIAGGYSKGSMSVSSLILYAE